MDASVVLAVRQRGAIIPYNITVILQAALCGGF